MMTHKMTEYISAAIRKDSKEAAVLLYAPGTDPYFEELVRNIDRCSTSMKDLELRH
jgi:hypothetical protein